MTGDMTPLTLLLVFAVTVWVVLFVFVPVCMRRETKGRRADR